MATRSWMKCFGALALFVAGCGGGGSDDPVDSTVVVTDGRVVDGTVVGDGGTVDGTTGDGTVVDGRVVDGTATDGTVVDGTVTDGTVVDGTVTDGTVVDGTVTDGTVVDGTVTDGTVADGGSVDGSTGNSCTPANVVDLGAVGVRDGFWLKYSGSTTGALSTLEPPVGCQASPNAGMGREKVHTFTLPVAADLIVSTDAASTQLDTVVYVLSSCAAGVAPMQTMCNDDVDEDGQNYSSTVTLRSAAPGTYYLVVDSYSGMTTPAPYELRVGVRPVVASGAACDASGIANRCDTGLRCGSGGTCVAASAPVLTSANFFDLGMSNYRVTVAGTDTDLDQAAFEIEFLDANDAVLALQGQTLFPIPLLPSATGVSPFRDSLDFRVTSITPQKVRVKLVDRAGQSSSSIVAVKGALPVRANGAACDELGQNDACGTGYSCQGSPSATCQTAAAPVQTLVAAVSAQSGDRTIKVVGTDVEGDIDAVELTFSDSNGTAVSLDVDGTPGAETPSVLLLSNSRVTALGKKSYKLKIDLAATAFAGSAVTQVSVRTRDAKGLFSNAVLDTFDAAGTPADGQSCDPYVWLDACAGTDSICDSNSTCAPVASAQTAACTAAASHTLSGTTPLTINGAVPAGQSRFEPTSCGPNTADTKGSEAIYKVTLDALSDVTFTTDFPQTEVDTIVYLSSNCGASLTELACADDVSFDDGLYLSTGVASNVPAGVFYVFVDSWAVPPTTETFGNQGDGPFKLQLGKRPIINTAGTSCDPAVVLNRCGGSLHCNPNSTFSQYTCQ